MEPLSLFRRSDVQEQLDETERAKSLTTANQGAELQLGVKPNGQIPQGSEDLHAFTSNQSVHVAVHPLSATSAVPANSGESAIRALNRKLQDLVLILLTAHRLPAWATDPTKCKTLFDVARALIPQLSTTSNGRKHLHREVDRFARLVEDGNWKALEEACGDAINAHNAKVAKLRAQCDVELEFDPDFLGQQGLMFCNHRTQDTEKQQHDDEQDEDEYEYGDDDDDDNFYDDDAGAWE
jgi:hypothetical protein